MSSEQHENDVPPISVVFAATHDSPTLRAAFETHRSALDRIGGELLIADGTDAGLPWGVSAAVHLPGADVFALRASATTRASGEIVAFTEDHCLPGEDWHVNMIRAHREHSDTAAIGGSVLNGSRRSAKDWANFLITFGPFLPPLASTPGSRVPPPANVSVKRAALLDHELKPGSLEMKTMPHFYRAGQMLLDDRIVVEHIQSERAALFALHHFDNGRSTASLPLLDEPLRVRLWQALRVAKLPYLIVRQSIGETWEKTEFRRPLLRAIPMIVVLACAHAAGVATGIMFGPGKSPKRLE